MIEPLLQQGAGFIACVVIIILTEPNINRMDCRAPLLLRLGLWALCTGSLAAVLFIVLGDIPPWPAVFGAIGVSLYLLSERRLGSRKKWERVRRDYA